MSDFEQANATVHKVEDQWHYPILTAAGFHAITREATGFVRFYDYIDPVTGRVIQVTTGSRGDYWDDITTGAGGWWSTLEMYVKGLPK